MTPMDQRLKHEVEHGRHLASAGAASIWNWDSPAGKKRWARRATWLCRGMGPGQRVLELGCGTGLFTQELAKTGADILAVDLSPDLLRIASERLGAPNVSWIAGDACRLDQAADSFDWVCGSSVLHHLDLEAALGEALRVLKAGACIRFTEPNMLNPQIALQKNIPWLKRRLGDSPDETAFIRWALQRKLEACGFGDIHLQPFDFLHPSIPAKALPWAEPLARALEGIPLLRRFAGSLMIEARKPIRAA